jgi:hypothetical protein
VLLDFAAHPEGVAIGEVVGDVAFIRNGNVGAFSSEADAKAIVFFEAVGDEPNSGFFASTDNGEEHGGPPGELSEVTMGESFVRRNGGAGGELWKSVDKNARSRRTVKTACHL